MIIFIQKHPAAIVISGHFTYSVHCAAIATRGRTKNRLRHFWTPSKGRTNIAESTIIRQEIYVLLDILCNKTLLLGRV